MDVVDFLFERIEEDEAASRKLLRDRSTSESGTWYEQRLLRECESKRRLLGTIEAARQAALARIAEVAPGESEWIPEALEWTHLALNALALPYADHPDFQKQWQLPEPG